uniref:C-type lectin domain-containing protein n=1 Tax=Pygocentrus nattereri TaxID=42514 RepID=A0A3B4DZY5_PYGNA
MCGSLWTLSFCGTRQFYVVNENKTWTDAQNYCRENFTDLATIESQEEMNSLVAVLKGKTGHFWIGLIEQYTTSRNSLRYCRENHVDLVSVHTEEIQHWVETAVYYASTANVWMGLRHTCTLSFWFWVSGVSICYQNWAPGNG